MLTSYLWKHHKMKPSQDCEGGAVIESLGAVVVR